MYIYILLSLCDVPHHILQQEVFTYVPLKKIEMPYVPLKFEKVAQYPDLKFLLPVCHFRQFRS